MADDQQRFEIVKRRRVHYPGFVTRVRLVDRVDRGTIDLSSAAIAELFLAALRGEEPILIVGPKLRDYRAETLKNGKTWLWRTDSAVASHIEGVTRESDLAERIASVLNRVDPAAIAPPPPPLPVKSPF